MKKSKGKIIAIVIGSFLLIGVAILIYFNIGNDDQNQIAVENEIVPQEEISDEQLRETTIKLYFADSNGEIVDEIRKVDSKILIESPYQKVLELLIQGPSNETLKSYIPKEAKINKVEKSGECVIIDFSNEFVEDATENVEQQGVIISQIVNTLTQFTEVNAVKITIAGDEDVGFKNGNIMFKQVFTNDD